MKLIHSYDVNEVWYNIGANYIILSKKYFDLNQITVFDDDAKIIFQNSFNHNNGPINYWENCFFLRDKNKDCYQFDIFTKTFKKIIDGKKEIRVFCNYFIYSETYSFEKTNQLETPAIKYIYKREELIWKYEKFGTIEIFSDRYALCFTDSNPIIDKRTRNQFSLLDLYEKTELWHFNLDDHLHKLHSIHPFDNPHKVGKPLGIYKDQLWFEMDNYGLMCLHKETGALLHFLRDLPYATGESYRGMPRVEQGYAVIPYTNEAILLKDESKIICFAIFYYWELDLETMQMSYHYLKDYFKEVECYTFGSRFKPLEVDGHLIYMVDTQHKKIGIFNRNTLRYEHIEPLPEGSGAPRSIEKHGDRLYVDTFGKKLLVYQIPEVI